MKPIKFLGLILATLLCFLTAFPAYADNNLIKFKIEVKPNQQLVKAHIDGDEHKQIQIKGEFVKLNPATNNYHIKITFTNNSGQPLHHQVAVFEKVEHSEVKFADGTTSFNKPDDNKQKTVTGPYYNYGNIKPTLATPRMWYLANLGKDEIEIKGYLIEKEIPIIIDTSKITEPGVAATLTKFLTGLRDNDLDMVLSTVAPPNIWLPRDLHKPITTYYGYSKGYLPLLYLNYINIKNIYITPSGNEWQINSWWTDPGDGSTWGSLLVLNNFGNQYGWLITEY